MTDSIGDQGVSGAPLSGGEADPGRSSDGSDVKGGPDPVIGAGITLLGIFVMGMGGARDLHYVFDVGMVTAVLGAGIYVLFVALSAMKQRKSGG